MSYLGVNQRLPLIVAPEHDESMTSWLERLAEKYQFPTVSSFLRAQPINWQGDIPRDFDRRVGGGLRDLLSVVTGMEPDELPAILQDNRYLMQCNLRRAVCLMCWAQDMDHGRPLYRRREWSHVFETCCHWHRFPLLDLPPSAQHQKEFRRLVQKRFEGLKSVPNNYSEIIETLIRFSEGMSWFDRSGADQWLLLEYLSEVFFEINEDLRGWAEDQCGRQRLGVYKLLEVGAAKHPHIFGSPFFTMQNLKVQFRSTKSMGTWRLAPDSIPYIGLRRQIFFSAIVVFAAAGASPAQRMQYDAGVTRWNWAHEHLKVMIDVSRKALQLN